MIKQAAVFTILHDDEIFRCCFNDFDDIDNVIITLFAELPDNVLFLKEILVFLISYESYTPK